MSAAPTTQLLPLAEAAERAGCGQRSIRRWVTQGKLTRHEGPRVNGGRPPLLVAVSELEAHLGRPLSSAPEEAAQATSGQVAISTGHEAAEAREEPEEKSLADQLRDDLRVAQKVVSAIEEQLDLGIELPGRTIAAMSALIKTTADLKQRIANLEAQRPKGPRTEEEAQEQLLLALARWEDGALEMAFEAYRQRHTAPMEGKVCRITVDDGQGHQAIWTEAGWMAVAS